MLPSNGAAQRALIAGLESWTDSVLTRHTINYISCLHAEAPRFTPEFGSGVHVMLASKG
jgi:hypothetical protein